MISEVMPALYVAALYGASRLAGLHGNLRQVVVIDVLMVNWLVCAFARAYIPGGQLPAAFLCVDIATALWLSLRVKGLVAGVAEVFYIAIIMFNSAFFFANAFNEWTHWIGLSILAWGQLLAVTVGVLRRDLIKIAGRAIPGIGLLRRLAIRNKEIER